MGRAIDRDSRSGIFFWIVVCALAWILYFILTPIIWRWEARTKSRVFLEELYRDGDRKP
jgi:hypothetical protein